MIRANINGIQLNVVGYPNYPLNSCYRSYLTIKIVYKMMHKSIICNYNKNVINGGNAIR